MVAGLEVSVASIRGELSGVVPSVVANCSPNGISKVAYLCGGIGR